MPDFKPACAPPGAETLTGAEYSAEEHFRKEQERIFRRSWICSGRANAAAAPGDYYLVSLGDESLLVVRNEDGALRAHRNFCRHRGSRLCEEPSGSLSGTIRCPYHGWSYSLDGRLLGAPHMERTPGFDRRRFPLVPAALAGWEGFVFLNLGDDAPAFPGCWAPVMDRFQAWDIGGLRAGRRIEYDVAANWKLIAENYSECYHCPLVHPALARLSPADSGRNDLTEGPFLGGYMELRPGVESMSRSGRAVAPPLPGVCGEDLRRVYYYLLFPNLLLSLHPDYVMAHLLFPLSARRTRVVCEWLFHPDALAHAGFDPEDAVGFWDLVNRQDWQACERAQLGVASPAYTPGPYAASEGLLWEFDREYRRVMAGGA